MSTNIAPPKGIGGSYDSLFDGVPPPAPPAPPSDNEKIAKVCHEANRAYCQNLGDWSQVPWELAPEWQRTSAVNGVAFHLSQTTTPEQSHENWLKEKTETGWTYGPVKDVNKKTHPCFVPYHELPEDQRRKDALFSAVVAALR